MSLTSRTYVWNWAERGIDSYFDNGLFFHRNDITSLNPSARHCYGQDQNNVYNFSNWPLWDVTWCVSGQREDYKMHSQYSKILIWMPTKIMWMRLDLKRRTRQGSRIWQRQPKKMFLLTPYSVFDWRPIEVTIGSKLIATHLKIDG